ncbi:restriction endonuclease subunit S [Planctopirus hydrillae]|uniref:Type I restriction modification DNA specificity domain-containing protein n=1 Tax=Planctopirus hydrillae TaxID=1841610 RepID=A0A1C3EFW3_9PLAN|nr:restriction endonuclease subunit S [Planctopirus hydrillae]ODA32135.1 hypothetical protein A6X21_21730 [Planctopirus hydrillae]
MITINGWTNYSLGDVAPASSINLPAASAIVWNLSLEDIEPSTGRILNRQTCRVDELGSSKCAFDSRHVLYSKLRPYLNKVVLPDEPGVGTSELIPLLPDKDRICREYLAYYLRSPLFVNFANAHTRGANLPRIAMSELWEHEIPAPTSLDEQRRIVKRINECLSRVDEISILRAASLRDREHLLESLIEAELRAADGEDVALADVCSIESPLVDPRESRFQQRLHIGGANIESSTGRFVDLKTAREEKLKSSKFTFDSRMVLYNKIRPYLKKVARPDFEGLCSADMYPLLPDGHKLSRDYLFYLLLSRSFTRYAIDGSIRAGMPKVNRDHLFSFTFKLPSFEKQQSTTRILDGAFIVVEQLRRDMLSTSIEVGALRESILRKAFAGEL